MLSIAVLIALAPAAAAVPAAPAPTAVSPEAAPPSAIPDLPAPAAEKAQSGGDVCLAFENGAALDKYAYAACIAGERLEADRWRQPAPPPPKAGKPQPD